MLRETGPSYIAFCDPSGGSSGQFHAGNCAQLSRCCGVGLSSRNPCTVQSGPGVQRVRGGVQELWACERGRRQICRELAGGRFFKVRHSVPCIGADALRNLSRVFTDVMSGQCELLDNARLINQLDSLGEEWREVEGTASIIRLVQAMMICECSGGRVGGSVGRCGRAGLRRVSERLSTAVHDPAEQQPTRSDDPFGKQAARAFELKLMGAQNFLCASKKSSRHARDAKVRESDRRRGD